MTKSTHAATLARCCLALFLFVSNPHAYGFVVSPIPLTSARTFGSKERGVFLQSSASHDEESSSVSTTVTKGSESPTYLGVYNETVEFPCYDDLMKLSSGEHVKSRPLTLTATGLDGAAKEYDFCVKLYPRGGGHNSQHSALGQTDDSKKEKSGFGMSYAVLLPMFGGQSSRDEKVGAYLQFLPRTPSDTADASFSLRLKGQQRLGRRFDVEWRSGIRFVSLENSKLRHGMANDFGAHLMQTQLFDFFLGIHDESYSSIVDDQEEDERLNFVRRKEPVKMQVEVLLHPPLDSGENSKFLLLAHVEAEAKGGKQEGVVSGGFGLLNIKDLRSAGYGDEKEALRVGRIVVPVLRELSQRPRMFQQGVYPGVEYRLLRIIDSPSGSNKDLFYSQPGSEYELKPIYPLVQQLERVWPVRVNERDIPGLIAPDQYNLISAVGSVFAATTALVTAFIISQAVSLFFIPSKSMEPTLQIGDVLLVEKVSPRLSSFLYHAPPPRVGDVVLFHPPEKLRALVAKSGGRSISDRDLFVKRVAAVPGDSIAVVDKSGSVRINGEIPEQDRTVCAAEPLRLIEQYMDPSEDEVIIVPPGQVAVLGDCSSVSVDSRVWGPLPTGDIVGRPLLRLWPLSRFGPIESLPAATATTTSAMTNLWSD